MGEVTEDIQTAGTKSKLSEYGRPDRRHSIVALTVLSRTQEPAEWRLNIPKKRLSLHENACFFAFEMRIKRILPHYIVLTYPLIPAIYCELLP
jgi:hypothetical protein